MARKPAVVVILTGNPLLSAIAAGAVTRITQDQAASLDAANYQINTADVVDGAALVRLTDAGVAAAAAIAAEPVAPVAAKGGIEIDDDVPMPEGKSRAPREAVYPFDGLTAVGKSFHVPKTAENPDPAIRLSSSVSGARLRYSPVLTNPDGTPMTETYEAPVYAKDAAGEYVKGADGKRVVTGKEVKTREKRGEPTRDFKVVTVGDEDKRGPGARCFLMKLTA